MQAKQEEIAKKYNALSVKYEELEDLKVNMNGILVEIRGRKKSQVQKKLVDIRNKIRKFLKRKKKR